MSAYLCVSEMNTVFLQAVTSFGLNGPEHAVVTSYLHLYLAHHELESKFIMIMIIIIIVVIVIITCSSASFSLREALWSGRTLSSDTARPLPLACSIRAWCTVCSMTTQDWKCIKLHSCALGSLYHRPSNHHYTLQELHASLELPMHSAEQARTSWVNIRNAAMIWCGEVWCGVVVT